MALSRAKLAKQRRDIDEMMKAHAPPWIRTESITFSIEETISDMADLDRQEMDNVILEEDQPPRIKRTYRAKPNRVPFARHAGYYDPDGKLDENQLLDKLDKLNTKRKNALREFNRIEAVLEYVSKLFVFTQNMKANLCETGQTSCCICLEDFKLEQTIQLTHSCNHIFH